jgi:hypothetical protein
MTVECTKSFGCIYVAFGRAYLIQALNSVQSLRRISPGVPACIVTNTLREPPEAFREWDRAADSWVFLDLPDNQNRLVKTDLLRYTPFQRTLYLDCDTEVVGDVKTMARFLDYWDVALRLREEGYSPTATKGRQTVLDGAASVFELPHWNGGVVLFAANERVAEFFSLWNHYYQTGGIPYDQVSLVEAAFRSSCRILSLDGRWNAGVEWDHTRRTPQQRFILHYMFGIEDRIARQLMRLDAAVYGGDGAGVQAGGKDTATFIEERQRDHQRRQSAGGRLWRRWRTRLRRRLSALRRFKRGLTP